MIAIFRTSIVYEFVDPALFNICRKTAIVVVVLLFFYCCFAVKANYNCKIIFFPSRCVSTAKKVLSVFVSSSYYFITLRGCGKLIIDFYFSSCQLPSKNAYCRVMPSKDADCRVMPSKNADCRVKCQTRKIAKK